MTQTNPSDLNLATHRAEASVWDRRGWDGTREPLTTARILIGVGAAALALQALRHRSLSSRVLTGLGVTTVGVTLVLSPPESADLAVAGYR